MTWHTNATSPGQAVLSTVGLGVQDRGRGSGRFHGRQRSTAVHWALAPACVSVSVLTSVRQQYRRVWVHLVAKAGGRERGKMCLRQREWKGQIQLILLLYDD